VWHCIDSKEPKVLASAHAYATQQRFGDVWSLHNSVGMRDIKSICIQREGGDP